MHPCDQASWRLKWHSQRSRALCRPAAAQAAWRTLRRRYAASPVAEDIQAVQKKAVGERVRQTNRDPKWTDERKAYVCSTSSFCTLAPRVALTQKQYHYQGKLQIKLSSVQSSPVVGRPCMPIVTVPDAPASTVI